MKRELTPKEIIYDVTIEEESLNHDENHIPEYNEVYKKIKTALEIDKEGFNVYLIDDFSKDKLETLMEYIKELYSKREKPKDICYVIYEEEKTPKAIYLNNGKGIIFKEKIEELQNTYYEYVFKFYNSSFSKEKESVMDSIHKKRNEYIGSLMDMAKNEGFDVKPTTNGFAFIPLKEGENMSEKDYDGLESLYKEEILDKVGKLKVNAEEVLEQLKDLENESLEQLRIILKTFFQSNLGKVKEKYKEEFVGDSNAIEYLDFFCKSIEKQLMENFSTSFEEDEEKINEIIYGHVVNVIVDNSINSYPPVIFEGDPSVNNLIGTMEYENHNGTYVTDVSLIKGGALLRANEGCLILRLTDLMNNASAYYYLKKTLITEKVDLDYNRGYLELLSLSGLKPEPIKVDVKIILIGDYEIYDLLYSYDEDFKKIFKIKAEYNPLLDINDENKKALIASINHIINKNGLFNIEPKALKEIAKYLSRRAEDKNKLYFDHYEINRIMILANNIVKSENRKTISSADILKVYINKEFIEEEISRMYKDKKILVNVDKEIIGSINGLSVIDMGYYRFGKPVRITCVCHKGEGNIIDIQKESNLSGNIHHKAINILKAYLNNFIDPYSKLPVDFYLSFEQTYGKIDGDSASIAEIVCIISALTKIPIRQSVAVTGSINQFGEVQPIGGINEKIEGFFNICRELHEVKDKAVLIPHSNIQDLVLNEEVEEAILRGDFKIYTMESVEDAVEVMMANEKYSCEDILNIIDLEIKKFNTKK